MDYRWVARNNAGSYSSPSTVNTDPMSQLGTVLPPEALEEGRSGHQLRSGSGSEGIVWGRGAGWYEA